MLSAQSQDKRTSIACNQLFAKAGTPEQMIKLSQEEVIEAIRPAGLHNAKSKNILATSKLLLEQFNGQVPRTQKELMTLPGVGRKSAQRMAYKLLRSNKDKTLNLSRQLQNVLTDVVTCDICGVYLDKDDAEIQKSSLKHLCIGDNRDNSVICITESPADIYIIEENTDYNGDYFALHGTLSPLDGQGPELSLIHI